MLLCFNEAAALHRGKPPPVRRQSAATFSFNEAAALHRGKPGMVVRHEAGHLASMRPRHYTAENF